MVRVRGGHSLPELLVALTLLGTTLAAVATSVVLGARWTHDAILRQRALGVAEATLDSLAARDDRPISGAHELPALGGTMEWRVESMDTGRSARVRLTVQAGGMAQPVAELHGLWIPPLPEPLPVALTEPLP